jgi:hypothetical protein
MKLIDTGINWRTYFGLGYSSICLIDHKKSAREFEVANNAWLVAIRGRVPGVPQEIYVNRSTLTALVPEMPPELEESLWV